MDKNDIAQILIDRGVAEDAANNLKGAINGNDLMRLLSALRDQTSPASGDARAQIILNKYGIKLGSNKMAKSNDYLNAKFESIRGGGSLDEMFGCMVALDEGFSYAVEVSEQSRDRVLDWLDENQVAYQATSPTNYRVECGDRDIAYRTGRALSEILRRPTVRDSLEIQEAKSKNPNKRIKDAKAAMTDIKPRNPVVAAVKARGGAGAHDGGKDPRKVDKQGREAKHKPRFDEQIDTELTEGVMAMKPVNPLFRLRELAGLPLQNSDDIDGIEIANAPEIDPQGILASGPVGGSDALGHDPVADPMADMDGGMDAPIDDKIPDISGDAMPDSDIDVSGEMSMDADPMGDMGVPGELGSDPMEPLIPGAAMAPTQSDAMSQIEDALNNIQTGLADIRLSEYKSLIKKLQDLTNQAQMMGRDYLGERRKK